MAWNTSLLQYVVPLLFCNLRKFDGFRWHLLTVFTRCTIMGKANKMGTQISVYDKKVESIPFLNMPGIYSYIDF